MMTDRIILLPTDFSRHSSAALEVALSLAHEQNARLVILHVVPRAIAPQHPETFDDSSFAVKNLQDYRLEMEAKLRDVPRRKLGVEVQHVLREGDVAEEILKLAELLPSDMIVMGTHGRSAYARAMLGSVASTVSKRTRCRVLTVNESHCESLAEEPLAKATALSV